MNQTQPHFFKHKDHFRQTIYDLNSSEVKLPYNSEIHKAPENVRRSIKIGKYRKGSDFRKKFNSSNTEKDNSQEASIPRYNASNINNLQLIEGRKINQIRIDSKKTQYNPELRSQSKDTYSTQFENDPQIAITNLQGRVAKSIESKAQQIKMSKNLKNERKQRWLSPLKKGSLVIQNDKQWDKKQLKITFLNIQKASLANFYNGQRRQEEVNRSQLNFRQINNRTFNEGFNEIWNKNREILNETEKQVLENSSNTTLTSQSKFKKIVRKNKSSLSESMGFNTTGLKFKVFKPAFEQYFYRDFIWKVAFSNRLLLESPREISKKFKVFIGGGNNSSLIRSLFKRRSSWWQFTDKYEEANFAWTQIKINDYFKWQKKGETSNLSIKQSELDQEKGQSLKQKDFLHLYESSMPEKSHLPGLNKDKQDFKKNVQFRNTLKFMNEEDAQAFYKYFSLNRKTEEKLDGTLSKRNKMFQRDTVLNKEGLPQFEYMQTNIEKVKIHNHLQNNYILGNKKALFYTMRSFYERNGKEPFNFIPETFHITNGIEDQQYFKFLNCYYSRQKVVRKEEKGKAQQIGKAQKGLQQEVMKPRNKIKNIWILKPGEFTNRGNGIIVCMNLEEIKKILRKGQKQSNGSLRTYVIQSYIDKPFLYQNRKFDIRHFMMITSVNGHLKGFWYEHGYIRTTSYEYSVKNSFSSVHLTNDAVQKNLPDYGKYEKGNKITYDQFQAYLDKQYNENNENKYSRKYNFFDEVYPQIKAIAADSIKASSQIIDPDRKHHNFEIFGLDFMIDRNFKPWLIEINTNPCLELSCPFLSEILPEMIENALKISVDSLLPPPAEFAEKRPRFNDNMLERNKFELVYDSLHLPKEQGKEGCEGIAEIDEKVKLLENQADQTYEDDGNELDD